VVGVESGCCWQRGVLNGVAADGDEGELPGSQGRPSASRCAVATLRTQGFVPGVAGVGGGVLDLDVPPWQVLELVAQGGLVLLHDWDCTEDRVYGAVIRKAALASGSARRRSTPESSPPKAASRYRRTRN